MVRIMVRSHPLFLFSLLYFFLFYPRLAFTEYSQLSPRIVTTGSKLNMFVCFSFNLYNWVVCFCFSVSLVGPRKTNSNKMPTWVPSTLDDVRQENYKIDRSHFSQFMLIIFISVNTFYNVTRSYFILQGSWICTFTGFLKIYFIQYPESFIS